jgi:hyperosmotically inducible protein
MRTSRATIWLSGVVATTALLSGCASEPYDSNSNREAVDDSTIAANVKAALVQDPSTRASNISVNTMHGVVELTGFVDTPDQRHEAARVAGNVAGVHSVDNELHVNGGPNDRNGYPAVVGSAMSDDAITDRVQAALTNDPGAQGSRIKVSTYRGVVQLAGFVPSNSVRDEAGSVAGSVQGVRSVDNDLRVAP